MAAGFSLRKIKTPLTLGVRFKRARKRMKVEIADAELSTKIRSKYLEDLENDAWLNLPASAYTKGFVVRYANFLGLDADQATKQYLRERQAYTKNYSEFLSPKKSVKETKWIITPKLMIPTAAGLFVVAIFTYIILQVYGFAAAPELQIAYPGQSVVVEDEVIEVRGVTDTEASLYINDQKIQVASDGKFVTDYKLQKGINIIEVKAENKADKVKISTSVVEYKPQTAQK